MVKSVKSFLRQTKLQGKLSEKPSSLEEVETSWTAKKKQRLAIVPERSSDQLDTLGMDTEQPNEHPGGYVVCSRFPAFVSCHPCCGWAFGDPAIFESFLHF